LGEEEQQVVVDWTVIRDEEDVGGHSDPFCTAFFRGANLVSSGIDFAIAQFASSKWSWGRIRISGDGTNNSGRSIPEARDQAVSTG
jgi:Protein of unknown function (DUF1194)